MTTVAQALLGKDPLEAALAEGIESISQDFELTFTLYNRVVLPLDGLVFWVATATTEQVYGAFHFAINTQQDEACTEGVVDSVFTTQMEIDDLIASGPTTKWIASIDGLLIAFTKTTKFFQPANTYHYVGRALLPTEASQVVTTAPNVHLLIASNSLPAFILLNTYTPPYSSPYIPTALPTIYPSYLVPANTKPPYATVHIERSEPLAPIPLLDANSNPYQLTSDDVKITMFGLSNNQAALLRDAIVQFSQDQEVIGLQGDIGAIRDERAPQSDFLIIAQKKTLSFRVAYTQNAVIAFARKVFKTVPVDYHPTPL